MSNLITASSSRECVPALVAVAGERASMRFLEFFAANIRNPHRSGLCSSCRRISCLVR
jgi:hypothetical protein